MTSNLISDSEAGQRVLGFSEAPGNAPSADDLRSSKKLREIFRPELLNRIDEIVVFEQLKKQDIIIICKNMLSGVKEKCKKIGILKEKK